MDKSQNLRHQKNGGASNRAILKVPRSGLSPRAMGTQEFSLVPSQAEEQGGGYAPLYKKTPIPAPGPPRVELGEPTVPYQRTDGTWSGPEKLQVSLPPVNRPMAKAEADSLKRRLMQYSTDYAPPGSVNVPNLMRLIDTIDKAPKWDPGKFAQMRSRYLPNPNVVVPGMTAEQAEQARMKERARAVVAATQGLPLPDLDQIRRMQHELERLKMVAKNHPEGSKERADAEKRLSNYEKYYQGQMKNVYLRDAAMQPTAEGDRILNDLAERRARLDELVRQKASREERERRWAEMNAAGKLLHSMPIDYSQRNPAIEQEVDQMIPGLRAARELNEMPQHEKDRFRKMQILNLRDRLSQDRTPPWEKKSFDEDAAQRSRLMLGTAQERDVGSDTLEVLPRRPGRSSIPVVIGGRTVIIGPHGGETAADRVGALRELREGGATAAELFDSITPSKEELGERHRASMDQGKMLERRQRRADELAQREAIRTIYRNRRMGLPVPDELARQAGIMAERAKERSEMFLPKYGGERMRRGKTPIEAEIMQQGMAKESKQFLEQMAKDGVMPLADYGIRKNAGSITSGDIRKLLDSDRLRNASPREIASLQEFLSHYINVYPKESFAWNNKDVYDRIQKFLSKPPMHIFIQGQQQDDEEPEQDDRAVRDLRRLQNDRRLQFLGNINPH